MSRSKRYWKARAKRAEAQLSMATLHITSDEFPDKASFYVIQKGSQVAVPVQFCRRFQLI